MQCFIIPKVLITCNLKPQLLKSFSNLDFQTVCCYHVTYAFQSESTLYSCLNLKELIAGNRREIWSLSNCNGTRTHNHLVRKRTLNHLDKLAKRLGCVVGTYLYSRFDCILLSCHVRVSEWLHALYLLECQGTPCSKQAQNRKF